MMPTYTGTRAATYDAQRCQQHEWWMEHALVDQWAAAQPPGSRVLDAPVGTGRLLPIYVRHDLACVGVDLSSDMLALAKARGTAAVLIQQDLLHAELPQADCAVCLRFLNWLTAAEALTWLQRICTHVRGDLLLGMWTTPLGSIPVGGAHTHDARQLHRLLTSCGRSYTRHELVHTARYQYDGWWVEPYAAA